jgi:hypothetical protein
LYRGTLAAARDLFFASTTPESVVREGSERAQPDSTRAILGDMVAFKRRRPTALTRYSSRGSEHSMALQDLVGSAQSDVEDWLSTRNRSVIVELL